jgi:serine/threonine protein kinase
MSPPSVGATESHAAALSTGLTSDVVDTLVAGWQASGQPDTLAALDRYPQLRRDKSRLLDLVYEEYAQRVRMGQPVDPDEFCNRFPDYQSSIMHMIDTHRRLEGLGELSPFRWPEPGEHVDEDYLILRRLGRGSFGRVYLAFDEQLNRPVVVKVSPPNLVEARLIALLDHDNVIQVYRSKSRGTTLVVMPYVGTSTLEDLIEMAAQSSDRLNDETIIERTVARNRHPDDPAPSNLPEPGSLRQPFARAIVKLAQELAEGLAHLHAAGVQHRDLKPSNVVLSWDGRPVIVDFNLAVDEQRRAMHFGGTLQYMAPEQIRASLGECGGPEVDHRADLYSFGVILYELLANRHPFAPAEKRRVSGREMTRPDFARWLLVRQQAGCPQSGPIAPGIDPDLERLAFQCLEYDPQKRPRSARSLADELAKVLRRDPARERRVRRLKRGMAVAACAIALLGAGAALHLATRPSLTQRSSKSAAKHLRKGQPEEAIKDLDPVLKPGMVNGEGFFLRGVALLRTGGEDFAIQDFQRACKQGYDPDGAASAGIAYCYARQGVTKNVLHHTEVALKGGFDSAALLNNQAASRWFAADENDRDLEEALRDLDKALKRDPRLAKAYYNRSLILQRLSDQKQDVRLLDQAIEAVRDADRLGLRMMILFRHGAGLIMQRKGPLAEEEIQTTVRWLREAIALGYDPKKLGTTQDFVRINRRADYLALANLQPGQLETKEHSQLVDPLADMFR